MCAHLRDTFANLTKVILLFKITLLTLFIQLSNSLKVAERCRKIQIMVIQNPILKRYERRSKCKCAWEFDILISDFDTLNLHSVNSHFSFAQHFMKIIITRNPLPQITIMHLKCHFVILQIHHDKHGRPLAFLECVSDSTNAIFAFEMAYN